MSALHLVNPKPSRRLSVQELFGLLAPEHFDRIDQQVRECREAFKCPFLVRNYDEFRRAMADYFAHYTRWFTGVNIYETKELTREYWLGAAAEFAERHLGGYAGGLRAAERNSITGRDGGFIAVVDAVNEAVLKERQQAWVRRVFYEHIDPSDYNTQLRLAEEILRKFGPLLFPGEELLPHYVVGFRLEEFITTFLNHLNAIRRDWRY